jgi:DNA-binding winged helix-turn-helix (wHTH) protein/Tol biopolymer transport system component
LGITKEPASRLIYSFGPFQLDPAERRLVRDGRDLRLPPKVFETLVALVRRHGLLVEKDELMKELWPGMFVEEVTLAGNISQLRKALGDASGQDESQYIETVSKRGYRFIANVTEIDQPAGAFDGLQGAGAPGVAPGVPSKGGWQDGRAWITLPRLSLSLDDKTGARVVTGRGSRTVRIAWGAAGVLLGALVGMGIVYIKLKNAAPADIVARFTIQPPTDHQFLRGGSLPAISADGKLLVSPVQDTQGKVSLWLRSLNDTGEGRMLPGTEGASGPFWSPDGRSMGFFAGGKLKRIDSDGTGLQVLCDASAARGGAWSSTGIILFVPTEASTLYQIPANGGTPREVTTLNTGRGESSHRWPIFLPDGRHFLFFVRNVPNLEITGIYAGSLDSQDYHMVVRTGAWEQAFETNGTILYSSEGAVVAQPFDERRLVTTGEPTVLPERVAWFTVSRAGVLAYNPGPPGFEALTWYERDGKRGNPLHTGRAAAPALSPDGTQAVVTIISDDALTSDLWNFDLSRGTKNRLTAGPVHHHQVGVWQPDGRFVLFASIEKDKDAPHIFRVRSDGTGAVETVLATPGVREIPWSVCRDGRYLAYTQTPKGSQRSVWILPLTGDRKPFPLVQSQFANTNPAFSPDCKWVAYHSNETGRDEVYITHFPDAARRYLVSTRGGVVPHWRSDGRELFYFSALESSMIAVNVEEKAEGLSLGPPRALFHIAGVVYSPFDVTADGRRFLVAEGYPSAGPLTLVTNWQAELKNKK